MTDLLVPIMAGIGTWAVLVALFVIGRRKAKPAPPQAWAERKRARFPLGAPQALEGAGKAGTPGVPGAAKYHGYAGPPGLYG